MCEIDVAEQLKSLIRNKIGVDLDSCKLDYMTTSLLAPEIGLEPRDLLFLFFELQKIYGIVFTEDDIIDKRFDYFSNIQECICEKVGKKFGKKYEY